MALSLESQFMNEPSQPQIFKPRKPKPLPILETTTNAAGESFQPGDTILVSAPWDGQGMAEIVTLYTDSSGCAWATYKPLPQSMRDGWPWEGGCLRAARLIKA